jgi:hypothetical protein
MKTLFLAWQDPDRRRWYPVGRLSSTDGLYAFAYTKGAEQAAREAGFQPLASFPELLTVYVSEQLFPLFTNRLVPPGRPEYGDYLKWLSVPSSERDPVAILARSGGRRVTDTLEVFPRPERNDRGEYEVHFLLHGLNHMPPESVERASLLKRGEQLLVMRDFQNPHDSEALALRTAETFERDMYLLGYCPRYLRGDIIKLMNWRLSPRIVVERVNLSPAPAQFRVLCRALMTWPDGFEPFGDPEYTPLVPDAEARVNQISLPPRHLH